MSEKPFTTPSSLEPDDSESSRDRTDWELLRSMTDGEARRRASRDPDAPPTDEGFWKDAQVVWPPGKSKISLYVDNDVLAWFKSAGKGGIRPA
jgi:uncharacterized protein (DUF4415 family)